MGGKRVTASVFLIDQTRIYSVASFSSLHYLQDTIYLPELLMLVGL